MTVKQLEWKGDIQHEEDVYAKGLFGEYHVRRSNHGDLWSATFNEKCEFPLGMCDGELGISVQSQFERAKECCQIHHNKRVDNALTFVEGRCSTLCGEEKWESI